MITRNIGLKLQDFYIFLASNTRGSETKLLLRQPKSTLRRSFFTYRAGTDYAKLSKLISFQATTKNSK
ncbi:hypothetical protein Y032_0015g2621 [Ancylostoma ceylanicum]|uniref:Uncharacterized protein n=1 Tax=Ancylostoma ceylanicum TaxID=53326 RepID=A0A016V9H5_9BILA|nr:hypothetical protein Y032_0015g2621 [Ancylostoma ceylanicum]